MVRYKRLTILISVKRRCDVFAQGLAVLGRGAVHEFLEYFIKIAYVIESDVAGDLGDGIVCPAVHELGRFRDAVFHEVLDRRETGGALEAAAALTLADEDGSRDVVEGDGFREMVLNVAHRLFCPLCVLVDSARREPGGCVCACWELAVEQMPQLQDACF